MRPFSFLALLCKKEVRNDIRSWKFLLLQMLLTTVALLGMFVAIHLSDQWRKSEVVRRRIHFSEEIFRYEGISFRLRSMAEDLNWKCAEKDAEYCEEVETNVRHLCKYRYACFQTEMVFKHGEYIAFTHFDGLGFSANFTNTDHTAQDPAMQVASEEFERDRFEPYNIPRFHRFFGSLLHANGLAHNFSDEVNIRYLPHPEYSDWVESAIFDSTSPQARSLIYSILLLLPLLACSNLASSIADERKSKIKDYLLTIGLPHPTYHLHLVFASFVKGFPFCVIASLILFYSDALFVVLFSLIFVVYLLACLSLVFLITCVIRNHKVITDIIFTGLFAVFLIPMILKISRSQIWLTFLSSIHPSYGFFHSLDALRECSIKAGHLVWFSDFPFVVPLGITLLLQLVSSVFICSASMFIDYLMMNSFTPLQLFFKFKKTIGVNRERKLLINKHEDMDGCGKNVTIDVKDVYMVYPNGEQALSGVDLKIYEGQITVLLGQNGAGKSTLFDIIAGSKKATSGEKHIDWPQGTTFKQIGYCPQYNPFYPKMTVIEHLFFFAELGKEENWLKKAQEFMDVLKLKDYEHHRAETLSEGTLRKMVIAMSLMGSSNVILLDEPTAGVDTETRAEIKNFLHQQKKNKTILITTHYTDEAEDLGDRVAIMANGKVECSGSISFLCQTFGIEYDLKCVVPDRISLRAAAEEALRLAEEYEIPSKLKFIHGQEFCISLSIVDYENLTLFTETFDLRKESFGISESGFSTAPLEKVFLEVAKQTANVTEINNVDAAMREFLKENKERASYRMRMWNTLVALVYKRLCFEWRAKEYQIINAFLTALCFYMTSHFLDFAKPTAEYDLLALHECGRIGVVDGPEMSERIRRIVEQTGDCLVVEDISDVEEWHLATHLTRPPIIGALEIYGDSATIAMATNRRIYEPYIANLFYRAATNVTFDIKLSYQRNPNIMDENVSEIFNKVTMYFLMMISMTRFIRCYVVERKTGYDHLTVLTDTPKALYWLAHFIVDVFVNLCYYGYLTLLASYFDFSPSTLTEHFCENILLFLIVVAKMAILHRLFNSKNKAPLFFLFIIFITSAANFGGYMWLQKNSLPSPFEEFDNITRVIPMFLDPIVPMFAYQIDVMPNAAPEFLNVYFFLLSQLIGLLAIFALFESRIVRRLFFRFFCSAEPCWRGCWTTLCCRRSKKNQPEHSSEADGEVFGEGHEMEPLHPKREQEPEIEERKEKEEEKGETAHPPGYHHMNPNDIVLEVDDIKKKFGSKMAVRGLKMAVARNECFGLLGHNGAGKSTTFKILTGQEYAYSGEAWVRTKDGDQVNCAEPAHIGYCPQENALTGQLTGYQHLRVIAALHGYSDPAKVTDILLRCVGMTNHSNKIYKNLSGGQKRKIMVASSLLAQSDLIILDEPTIGIDPMVRNDIWTLLLSIRDQPDTRTAIILTSHSMPEVEALCSRIAVMKNGLILTAGSPQSIISKHGDYFKVEFSMPAFNLDCFEERFENIVECHLPAAKFVRIVMNRHCYKLVKDLKDKYAYSRAFGAALKVKRAMDEVIEEEIKMKGIVPKEGQKTKVDFVVVQNNLEDTFIALGDLEKKKEDEKKGKKEKKEEKEETPREVKMMPVQSVAVVVEEEKIIPKEENGEPKEEVLIDIEETSM